MTSSMQRSSPRIRRRRNMDQTTTSLPQTSSKANQSGKWSRSWEQGASEAPDDSNIESDGQDTPTHMTPGRLRMTYMLHNLLRISGKETNSLSISLMTTNGPSHNNQPHPHRSRITSNEEHPHPSPSNNEGSDAG